MVNFKYTNLRDSDQRLYEMHENMIDGGIAVDPTPITAGQEVTVLYDGLLSHDGAEHVFLHVGYGNNQSWQKVGDYQMSKLDYGWEKKFKIQDDTRFNFCFKDCADNWDNNSGQNWSFEIHNGRF